MRKSRHVHPIDLAARPRPLPGRIRSWFRRGSRVRQNSSVPEGGPVKGVKHGAQSGGKMPLLSRFRPKKTMISPAGVVRPTRDSAPKDEVRSIRRTMDGVRESPKSSIPERRLPRSMPLIKDGSQEDKDLKEILSDEFWAPSRSVSVDEAAPPVQEERETIDDEAPGSVELREEETIEEKDTAPEERRTIMSLKVKEALSKDVGRAIARIDPKDMKTLNVEVGDIVLVEGKRKTAAKVMPCYSEERGQKIIQIDGLTRQNAQIGLDDKVKVHKVDYNSATSIILEPLTVSRALRGEEDGKYIGSLIAGIPVIKGDKIRATLIGTRACEFKVISTSPDGVVLISPSTAIRMETKGKPVGREERERPAGVSYEDIGGLDNQVQRIREMVELPLRFPEVFERLGIDPPKGVFLHGPPGCGKTLIARAVANETDAYFTSMSGPECMGKFYGESEQRLRSLFEDAQAHAPAIVFIDEIESIAPKREEMGAEKQVERRVVAQLLALMDGLESRGHVVVMAATNVPNIIDPALRRPGRFDREIIVPIPDKNARLEILQIHTRGMPLAEDVDLEKLGEITHGYVGADIEALAREAAMCALRKILPKIDFEMADIPYETLMKLEVTMDNFLEAMKEIEPSAIREVFVEVPDVGWKDVGGLDSIKQELKEAVEWPLKYGDVFKKANTNPSKGILLYGPPGTGKTLIAKAVANESGVNFISVKGPALISKYVGESERGIREVFKKAKQASPTILFFDEIDSVVPRRGSSSTDAHVTERVISQFLTEMDGIEELKGVMVLGATNRFDLVDPALLRSGRFDLLLELPMPDEGTRYEIFKIHTRGKPIDNSVDLKKLAREVKGKAGSDIEFICRKAAMFAIREFIEKPKKDKEPSVRIRHFEQAMALLK